MFRARGLFAILVSFVPFAACSNRPDDVSYGPYRSLIEIVAEIDSARDADIYRFEPPRDVTGENLFRASLARLAKLEELVADPALKPAISFARAEASERLLDFGTAAKLYAEVANGKSGLAAKSAKALPFAKRLAELTEPFPEQATPADILGPIERRRSDLVAERDAWKSDPRKCLVDVAIEQLDVRRREFLWKFRAALPDGTNQAIDAGEKVARNHAESRRLLEHLLRLGDMYAELVNSQLSIVDPHDHAFDASRARNLIQAAAQVYAEVAAVDGRIEREEARAKLAALDALEARFKPGK